MKNIIYEAIDRLFDLEPFSRQSECHKEELKRRLGDKYERESKDTDVNDIELAGRIVTECATVESADKIAGINTENVRDKEVKDVRQTEKIYKKAFRYVYIQAFCIAGILEIILMSICNFSLKQVLGAALYIVLLVGVHVFVSHKKKKYLESVEIQNMRFNRAARKYIEKLYDRYSKKYMNTVMVSVAFAAYFLIVIIVSIVKMNYSIEEIIAQINNMSTIIQILTYFLIKNKLCGTMAGLYFTESTKKNYKLYFHRYILGAVVYFAVAGTLSLIISKNAFNGFTVILVIYAFGCLLFNMTLRRNIVFINIRKNLKRAVLVCILCVVIVGVRVMSMDVYLTQSYINTVARVLDVQDDISYNEDNGVYTITTAKENFKVLQLTDIHLGGSAASYTKDIKALKACYKLIKATKPDFVVVTGDLVFPMGIMSFSLNNNAPVMQFANFMRNTGIPWAFTYGNHDTEDMAVLDESRFDSLMKSLSFKTSKNLLYPYIQPDIYGRNNQVIEVRNKNGDMMQALFLIDSNDYIEGSKTVNEYDYIHDDQVEWYEKKVNEMSAKEGHTIPSMIFFHIPIEEYKTANDLYESGSNEVKYFYGELGEKMINKICCSEHDSKLFETAEKLGSTKAMFCGHDHYNNQSVEYKGIRLTYGYSIDYLAMPGIENDQKQRGATLITIEQDGTFDIEPYRLMDLK